MQTPPADVRDVPQPSTSPLKVQRLHAALRLIRAHGLDHDVLTFCRVRCGGIVYHATGDKVRVNGRNCPGTGLLMLELLLTQKGQGHGPDLTPNPASVPTDVSAAIGNLECLVVAALHCLTGDDPDGWIQIDCSKFETGANVICRSSQ